MEAILPRSNNRNAIEQVNTAQYIMQISDDLRQNAGHQQWTLGMGGKSETSCNIKRMFH